MIEFIPGVGLEFRPALPSEKDYEILSLDVFEHAGSSSTPRVAGDANLLDHTSEHSNPGYALFLVGDTDDVVLSAADATGLLTGNHLSRVSDGICRVVASHPLISRGVSFDMTTQDLYEYTTLDSYVLGSLARSIVDDTIGLIGDKTSTAKPLFSAQDHTTPIYTRNTDCWAYPLNLTGMSPWNSRGGWTRSGTAITPRHIILAAHYPLAISDTIRFITSDNVVITRTITGSQILDDDTDTQICLLDSDLPASITPLKFLPANVADYLPSLDDWTVPVLAFDAQENALCQRTMPEYWSRSERIALFAHSIADPFNRMTEQIVGGDSGNPIFMIVNNVPVLLSHWTGSTTGPKYYAFLDEIAAALVTLGGGHSLSAVDLSSFTDYS